MRERALAEVSLRCVVEEVLLQERPRAGGEWGVPDGGENVVLDAVFRRHGRAVFPRPLVPREHDAAGETGQGVGDVFGGGDCFVDGPHELVERRQSVGPRHVAARAECGAAVVAALPSCSPATSTSHRFFVS